MGNSQTDSPQANILVVDDTPANLQLLVSILVENGYTVQLASDGRTALSLAQTEPPDLILLDIMMPGMDGYQVCEQLKADERTRDVPVIFLSALNEVFDKVKAFSVGGIDYIIKPFHIEEVLAHVKTHLAVWATKRQLERQNTQLEQEIVERSHLEKELRQHRNHLELKVAERTAELKAANQQLQQEISERKRAEEKLQDSLQKLEIAYEQAEIYAQELKKEIIEHKQAEAEREQLLNLEHEQWLLAETLRQAVAVLNSTLNYEEVLDLILEQMNLVLPFHDAADIMLIEQDTVRALRWHGYEQFEAETYITSLEFNIAEIPTLQTMWTTDRPLIISEVENYKEWVHTPETAWIKSYMGVPIHIRERVIGFMNVSSTTPGFFKETDAERLQALADQAGVALENARLFESVNRQRKQLRALTARLAEAEEVERRQLARELHDQAGQNLTALSLNLRMTHNQITKAGKLTEEEIEQVCIRLEDSLALVKETTKRIRNVMNYLRPPALEEYGLVAALRWYGQEFSSRTNIAVTVQGEEPEPRLPALTETALFRIAQEALTNVSRHAQATQVEVKLTVDEAMVRLVIVDNGVGFKAEHPAKRDERQHWGLLNMVERAQAVGSQCRVESAPGEGTRVMVEVKR
jgi:signal transduction histidine kinase/FixJ family two-component response regulator